MPRVLWTVFRGGGEYQPEHVSALARNLRKIHPDATLAVVGDGSLPPSEEYSVYTPARNYPGWWHKMNLMSLGEIAGDILYCDLDTVLVGSLDDLWAAPGDIVLRDFYRAREGIGSGLMRLTPTTRNLLWAEWHYREPEAVMERLRIGGDQALLEEIEVSLARGPLFRRWQDACPGRVCSFKVHIRDQKLDRPPGGVRVCCMHGHPRPWHIDTEWIKDARA